MPRFPRLLAAAASAVAIAATITTVGLTAASASPAARGGPAAHPSVTRTERFQIVSGSTTSNRASIIAAGSVFTAGGVDIQGNSTDTAKFPGGTFKIHHSPGTGKPHFSARTCLFSLTLRGTYRINRGTGRFKGISGHGKYVARILIVAKRNSHHVCSMNLTPRASQTIINAQGPLHL